MNKRFLSCAGIALATASLVMGSGAALADTARAARAIAQGAPADAVKAGVDAWSAGDYSAAVRLWQPLADRGDADAQFNLAQAYKLGRGVPLDLTRAEELYGKAAATGHVQAADSYGLLLFQRGERQKALPYVQSAAARGDARAMYLLGVAHFNGDVVSKDWVRAYALASLARDAGLQQATRALAQMDQYIPIADRQKSVVLGRQLLQEAQANRERLAATAELGRPFAAEESRPAPAAAQIAAAQNAVADAARASRDATLSEGKATAGADYTRAKPTAPAPKPPARTAAQPAKPAGKPALAVTGGPWRVQLGAFGVPGNAEALWAKVRSRPELTGHAKALVSAGKLVKLQATGFSSQGDAQAACARLRAAGLTCLPLRD